MNEKERSIRSELQGHDPLDDLLASAKWPEPEKERVQELRAFYVRVAQRRVVQLWMPVAAAATVLVAAMLAVWMTGDSRPIAHVERVPGEQHAEQGPALADGDAHRMGTRQDAAELREPNALEQLVAQRARPRAVQPNANSGESKVQEALAAYMREVHPNVQRIKEKYLTRPGPDEQQLLAAVRNSTGIEQRAAVALLTQIATWRSLPTLIELFDRPEWHEEVAPRLARLAHPVDVLRLVRKERATKVRTQLIAGLLDHPDPLGLELYLNLLNDPALEGEISASVAYVREPPVEALLRLLQDNRVSRRVAAAQTLGRLNRPEISKRLIAILQGGQNQREALLALMNSSEPLAVQFVERAAQDLNMMASVRAVQVRFKSSLIN